jgi:hypothetical protein
MLFHPFSTEIRRFFCSVYAKAQSGQSMDAIETIANLWMDEHPEYHDELSDVKAALKVLESAEDGLDDAFLHLTLHLSISEQCAMDQPRGIRQAVDLLSYRRDSLHAAHHEVMGCLKQTLLASQKTGHIPDETTYLACVQRHSTRERSFFHMD